MIFSATLPVRFGDCDFAGIAYYPRLLALVDAAIEDWTLAALGVDRQTMHRLHHCGLPTRSLSTDFARACRLGENLDIAVAVQAVSARSVTLRVAASVGLEVRFTAVLVQVPIDTRTTLACAWPQDWRARLEGCVVQTVQSVAG